MYVKFSELPVFDQDRARDFYVRNLGMTVAADAPMGQGDWRWLELAFPGARTTLHFVRRADDSPSDMPVLVLVTADVAATVAALKEHDVEIITEPSPSPWAPGQTHAEFRDSEGNRMIVTSS